MQASAAEYDFIYFTTPKRELVARMAVGLTAAIFKIVLYLTGNKLKSILERPIG
jgi:hypothetical protein